MIAAPLRLITDAAAADAMGAIAGLLASSWVLTLGAAVLVAIARSRQS